MKLLVLILTVLFVASGGAYFYFTRPYYPTVHEYILETKTAQFVEPDNYYIDGHQAKCGSRPTVLYDKFDSWGGAYPGFIIMNPLATQSLPTTVKLYIYYHECGHQYSGVNETKSDNFAIEQGLKSGWLKTKRQMDKICHFVSKIPADKVHKDGKIRCQIMSAYFDENQGKHAQKRL